MVLASLAAMVTFQMRAEPDVSRRLTLPDHVTKEKSSALTEPHALLVDHTPEHRETTPSASQTTAKVTKSSPG
jgi:hypothetical protein